MGGARSNSGAFPNLGLMGTVATGQWTRIIIGMKLSTSASDGWVEAYVNGTRKIARTSLATLDKQSNGTADPIYLKQGIYRDSAWDALKATHMFSTATYLSAQQKRRSNNRVAVNARFYNLAIEALAHEEDEVIAKDQAQTTSRDKAIDKARNWREVTDEVFTFACYAKEDFDSDNLEKKRTVIFKLGEKLSILAGTIQMPLINTSFP